MPQTSTDHERLLRLYLDDHRAGAAGGVALARRMLEENPDNYLTATLRELTDEINADREVLDDVIGRSATLRTGSRWSWVQPARGWRG